MSNLQYYPSPSWEREQAQFDITKEYLEAVEVRRKAEQAIIENQSKMVQAALESAGIKIGDWFSNDGLLFELVAAQWVEMSSREKYSIECQLKGFGGEYKNRMLADVLKYTLVDRKIHR